MAEFTELLLQLLYSFLQRFTSFTVLLYKQQKKLEVEEEEDGDELEVLSLQSRELKASKLIVHSRTLPTPTPPPGPEHN